MAVDGQSSGDFVLLFLFCSLGLFALLVFLFVAFVLIVLVAVGCWYVVYGVI